jgi:hypothetical protein
MARQVFPQGFAKNPAAGALRSTREPFSALKHVIGYGYRCFHTLSITAALMPDKPRREFGQASLQSVKVAVLVCSSQSIQYSLSYNGKFRNAAAEGKQIHRREMQDSYP